MCKWPERVSMTTNLLDFDLAGLTAFCEGLGEKRFRPLSFSAGFTSAAPRILVP